jgi:lipopolysaccharide heptosyltransferase II
LARSLGVDLGTGAAAAESSFFPAAKQPVPPPTGARIKIGLCPGAEYGPAKRWYPERFSLVACAVARRLDCEWVLFGVASDASAGDQIEQRLEGRAHCTNLIGKTTLAELMDRLSECSLVLTNDTGTMHLAAFLGVPVVAIFGSTEPRLTGPLGAGHQVLRHQVECSPCFQRECPLDLRCMQAVTEEETVRAIYCALARNSALVFRPQDSR